MTAKFLDSFGGKFAERWVANLFTPAFIFWLGGFIAAVQQLGWNPILNQYTTYPEPLQLAILVIALLGIAASAFVAQRLDTVIIRFLEGYWPPLLRPLQNYRITHYRRYKKILTDRSQNLRQFEAQQKAKYQKLKTSIESHGANSLTALEQEEYRQLTEQFLSRTQRANLVQTRQNLHNLPDNIDLMPTRLGNILRAAERKPQTKYGLDAIICWPRLWLLLPDSVKQDLQDARSDLNNAARLWLWSLLFILWAFFGAWWAPPLGILSALFAYYNWAIAAATAYGDLLEATFDLYRHLLYESLRWHLPSDPTEERRAGEQLTKYLWQGFD